MPYFNHDRINFHYLARPPGGASPTTLVFQHGLGGDTERVFELLGPLSGFSLVGLDCRGHGKTTPLGEVEKLSFDSFADDVVALLDRLGVRQAIVGGTSMGAGVALNCAIRYPQRVVGLVLLRPAWLDRPLPANVAIFGLIAKLLREHGTKKGAETLRRSDSYKSILSESPDAANSLMELFSHPRALETVAKLERIPHDAPDRDRAEWHQISLPTLVLANRSDPIHPFEFGKVLSGQIPQAEFAELTPKSVNLAKYTAEVRSNIATFLQRHWPLNVSAMNHYA